MKSLLLGAPVKQNQLQLAGTKGTNLYQHYPKDGYTIEWKIHLQGGLYTTL